MIFYLTTGEYTWLARAGVWNESERTFNMIIEGEP